MKHDPASSETYGVRDVSLREDRWNNPMRVTRWIQAGRGAIELPEQEWIDLCELMTEYLIEHGKVKRKGRFSR